MTEIRPLLRFPAICSLSPWERARERAKQSNPPEAPYSVRRKFVARASLTKTGKPIPFAIISANVIHRQSSRYGSVQNPHCFQTTFRIKRSSEIRKPALLPFRIQIQSTSYIDTAYYQPSFPRRRESIENFKKRVLRNSYQNSKVDSRLRGNDG